jgi:hypothetical protein
MPKPENWGFKRTIPAKPSQHDSTGVIVMQFATRPQVSWRILNKYYNSTSPQDLYVLVVRTSEYAYAVCPPVRSNFFIWCGVCKGPGRVVPALVNLLARSTWRCKCKMLQKRGRSDKAETYRDRFDMVVKIEECLFVSRCHQGRGRNVSGATRLPFQSLPMGMSGGTKGA